MNRKVNIGLIQMSCSTERADNLSKTVSKIEQAARSGAQVVCLQELFMTQYFCNEELHDNFQLAEKIPGATTDALSAVAKKHDIVIIASLFEKRAEGLYHNTVAVIDADGSYLGIYRKNHIPDDPGYYEKFYFTPGDTGYKSWHTKYGKIGVLICWDQWYPEAARLTALHGAEILFFPTAIGWDMQEKDDSVNQEQYNAWFTIQRSHAVANGVFVASVNRVGEENGQKFWGASFVANPFGSVLCKASHDEEEVIVQEVDLQQIDNYRTTWPFMRDRRIDTYGEITKRWIED